MRQLSSASNVDSARTGAVGLTVTATPRFKETPVEYPVRNVVAMIQGSDPKLRNQFVAIGAHNDHVGLGARPVAHDSVYIVNHLFRTGGGDDRPPQLDATQQARVNSLLADIRRRTNGASARPDSIYNGADDECFGQHERARDCAILRRTEGEAEEIAALRLAQRRRSRGCTASEWYTDHPTVPRDSIVAQLNMDMVGRGSAADNTGITKDGVRYSGNPDYVQLVGARRLSSELGDLAESVNRAGKNGRCRSTT